MACGGERLGDVPSQYHSGDEPGVGAYPDLATKWLTRVGVWGARAPAPLASIQIAITASVLELPPEDPARHLCDARQLEFEILHARLHDLCAVGKLEHPVQMVAAAWSFPGELPTSSRSTAISVRS